MQAQPNTRSESRLSLPTYLAVQMQEIICMGPGHALTWADNHARLPLARVTRSEQALHWLQVSVQGGAKCHLMVQFVLPDTFGEECKRRMDGLFAQYGWINEQADGRECLVYYVAQSPNPRRLLDEAEFAARQCGDVMAYLWNARDVDDIALLGARGPRLVKQNAAVMQPNINAVRARIRAA